MKAFNTKDITILAVFIALDIILTRFFSINVWNIRIGFGFVPTIMVAHMYGIKFTITECALSDIIGAVLFPTGAYFVGFTISAMVMGLIWGSLLYKESNIKKIVLAVLLIQVICSLTITSASISFLYKVPLFTVIIGRIGQVILMTIVELLLIPIVINKICPIIKKRGIY